MARPKRILVAPLNWGLGHATRCIPIIQLLLDKGCEVVVASSERPYHLLKQAFPQLAHLYFPNYEISYPENENMAVTILRKSPEMFWETRKENRRLQELIWEYAIDGVIADNRFGFYNRRVPTVFLAHQLSLHMTPGFGWLKPFADAANLSYARRFTRIWIPDFAGADNLSGSLSHFDGLPRNACYVGPLSRFNGTAEIADRPADAFELLITMSGPEPQRTFLEERLTAQALELPYKTLLVVGKTEDGITPKPVGNQVFKAGHLPSAQLKAAMQHARYMVCRSGYSTIMDLAALGLKAAFIPTPGQPEQEYLAELYAEKGIAPYAHQQEASIAKLIENYADYKGFVGFNTNAELLNMAMDEFLLLTDR